MNFIYIQPFENGDEKLFHSTLVSGCHIWTIHHCHPSHGRINRIAKVPAKKHQIAGSYTLFVCINSTKKNRMKFQICQKQKKQKQLFCLYIYLSLSPFVLFFDHLIWFALILSIFTTRILIYSIVFWSFSLFISLPLS